MASLASAAAPAGDNDAPDDADSSDDRQRISELIAFLHGASGRATVEFISEASHILGLNRIQALDLASELGFENGELVEPSTLFAGGRVTASLPPGKGTASPCTAAPCLRTLYYDTIVDAVLRARARPLDHCVRSSSTASRKLRHYTEAQYQRVEPRVDKVVIDLWKAVTGMDAGSGDAKPRRGSRGSCYAMGAEDFTDLLCTRRHDLRFSEAQRLLKPLGFEGGLCINPCQKWFEDDNSDTAGPPDMRDEYWLALADTLLEGGGLDEEEEEEEDGYKGEAASPGAPWRSGKKENSTEKKLNTVRQRLDFRSARSTGRATSFAERNRTTNDDDTSSPDWALPVVKKTRRAHASAARLGGSRASSSNLSSSGSSTTSPRSSSSGSDHDSVHNESSLYARRNVGLHKKSINSSVSIPIRIIPPPKSDADARTLSSQDCMQQRPISPPSPTTPDWGASFKWKTRQRRF